LSERLSVTGEAGCTASGGFSSDVKATTVEKLRLIKDEKQIVDEEVSDRKVAWSTYGAYVKCSSGAFALHALLVLGAQIVYSAASVVMERWADRKLSFASGMLGYLGCLFAVGELRRRRHSQVRRAFAFAVVLTVAYSVASVWFLCKSALELHTRLMHSLFHLPMSFFDSVPVGRWVRSGAPFPAGSAAFSLQHNEPLQQGRGHCGQQPAVGDFERLLLPVHDHLQRVHHAVRHASIRGPFLVHVCGVLFCTGELRTAVRLLTGTGRASRCSTREPPAS